MDAREGDTRISWAQKLRQSNSRMSSPGPIPDPCQAAAGCTLQLGLPWVLVLQLHAGEVLGDTVLPSHAHGREALGDNGCLLGSRQGESSLKNNAGS